MPELNGNSRFVPQSDFELFDFKFSVTPQKADGFIDGEFQNRLFPLALATGTDFLIMDRLFKERITDNSLMAKLVGRTYLDCVAAQLEREFGLAVYFTDLVIEVGSSKGRGKARGKTVGAGGANGITKVLTLFLKLAISGVVLEQGANQILTQYGELLEENNITPPRSIDSLITNTTNIYDVYLGTTSTFTIIPSSEETS
jgi:hypothetical protein